MLFRTKRIYSICCVLIVLIFQGCSRLPKDFSSQSLEEKIEIYANYIEKTGQTDRYANLLISWHGIPAANLVSLYLNGDKKGIPPSAAIDIIMDVQLRGCPLRDTAAQRVLELYLSSKPTPLPYDEMLAKEALACINENRHFKNFDTLPPGPCSGK